MGKKLLERFTKTNFKSKTFLELKKLIKRKGNKLHVKWKVSFNSWINKKDIV